jgi:hypothetical protein
MCHLPWQPPQWDRVSNQKHRTASKRNWERSTTRAWTGEKNETAQFDPNLTDGQIERMEIEATTGEGIQIQDRCHKRTFYRRINQIIGASAGEHTVYIFVEYHNTGAVHGRPMTWNEIEAKLKRATK